MTSKTRRFEFKSRGHRPGISVEIVESLDTSYGMYVWPSAPVLAQYLWMHEEKIKDSNVLEIGSGTSLPGILAAKLGASVILSEASHLPNCAENSRKSCEANNLKDTKVVGISWGQFSPDLVQIGPLDIILGSDCFYDSKDFEDIIVTVAYLLDRNPDCEFWTTYQERSSNRTIFPLLEKWNLCSRSVPLDEFEAEHKNLASSNLPGDHTIHMLIIKNKR